MNPLFFAMTDAGESELDSAMAFLSATISTEYAELFTAIAGQAITEARTQIAEEIATDGRPFASPHEAASLRFSRPVYRLDVSINRSRQRRSSSGLWYFYYILEDRNNVGHADTFVIIAVRHSAAAPFTIESQDDTSP